MSARAALEAVPAEVLDGVVRLHGVVDELTGALARRHAANLRCGAGCASCCVDELTVFEVEAARIATFAADVLRQAPGPVGACAFLDESKSCRIYEHRPYVCRTQGLPLRWVEQRRGRIVERRDACTLNFQDLSVHSLPKDDCWSLGPVEARLLALQDRVDGGAERRIALRDLFEAPPPAEHAP